MIKNDLVLDTSKIIIAGPCAVESREQVFATAWEISNIWAETHCNASLPESHFDFQFFRAGIWKPRTNPSDFQGAGIDAFEWLREIKEKFGFKVCVEVASAEHAKLSIENKMDAVWIGARSTVNPFIVQEIAEAVNNSSIAVLVKNPINPDINLWMGAINRFQNVGIKNVMAIHRGFSVENENVFRNAPCWEIPVALRLKFPELPILCDISHIAGNISLQPMVAQTALNYGFNGLMTEVHHSPENALSDSNQQLLPSQFAQLLDSLKIPITNNETENALFVQRNLIKSIDIQISNLLRKRMIAVDEVAAIKAQNALPLLQPEQWKKVVKIYEENALQDENYQFFLKEFLLLLHKSSLKRQE